MVSGSTSVFAHHSLSPPPLAVVSIYATHLVAKLGPINVRGHQFLGHQIKAWFGAAVLIGTAPKQTKELAKKWHQPMQVVAIIMQTN